MSFFPGFKIFEVENVQNEQDLLAVSREFPAYFVHPFSLADVIFILDRRARTPGCHKTPPKLWQYRQEVFKLEYPQYLPSLWISQLQRCILQIYQLKIICLN
jgi:hypothetical protein